MKKYIYLGFLMVLLVGCATMRYSNEYGDNHVMLTEQYEAIKPGLNWSKTYPEGCSVIDFYEHFPEYDEIVNVSITEQINETKLGVLVISKKSFCKYTGIGVKYKNNSSRANAANNIRQQNAKESSQLIVDNLVIRNILTDSRDGQKYKTIKLGRQEWMAENLNFYEINMGNKSRCYGDDIVNCSKYGRLYTWAIAMDSAGMYSYKGKGCGYGELCNLTESYRGVCPEGWHLPNKSEWETLWNAIGGKRVSGIKLKSTTGWVVGGEGADDYEFAILPAGYFDDVKFGGLDSCSGFWTSTEKSSKYAYAAFVDESKQMDIDEYEHSKKEGRSIRCVKD